MPYQKGHETNLGRICKEETKIKIRKALLGRKISEETRNKISISGKGRKSWNKGLTKETDYRVEKISKSLIGNKLSEETKQKLSIINKGKHHSPKTEFKKGKKHTEEHKLFMSNLNKKRCLEGKHNFWRGGITELQYNIRHSLKYKTWINLVFIRDQWTCQYCGNIGCRLEAHHKKAFASILKENNIKTFEEAMNCQELWDVDNGECLCKECHKKTSSYLNNSIDKIKYR